MITFTATIKKFDGSLINLNYRNALSLERSIYDRSDLNLPSWGIISNRGNLRFIDKDGSIKRLAEQRLLKSGMEVNYYLTNTINNNQQIIGNLYTDEWDYDNSNKQVSVRVKDNLEEWQETLIPTIEYSFYDEPNSVTYADVYRELYSITPSKFNMLSFDELDSDTQMQLNDNKIYYNIRQEPNLWSAWNSLAVASLSHIYKDKFGRTIFKYNGGN